MTCLSSAQYHESNGQAEAAMKTTAEQSGSRRQSGQVTFTLTERGRTRATQRSRPGWLDDYVL